MRVARSFVFCAAAAFITAGCEVRTEPASVAVSGDVAVDEPQGEVIEGAGVEAIDVEPDPAQRVYVYDEGYPPGTYLYNGYYYYGGYRYPHDIFVNRYVQENIRQHKFVDTAQNRRLGAQIEQRHRTEFSKTHGVRQNNGAKHQATENRPAENRATENRPAENRATENRTQTPARATETPRPNAERPEVKTPARNEEPRVPEARPENKPNPGEERRVPEAHPENKANPAEERRDTPENKANPAKPGEDPKRDEQK